MNNEKDIEKLFVEKLKDYGYPDSCVIPVSKNSETPGDIVIKNGKRYVQAFEIKTKDNPDNRKHYFSQYVEYYKIKLPVYFVIPTDGGFEYYDKDAIAPLDEHKVLNYDAATDKFVEKVKEETDKKRCCFHLICLFLFLPICGADMYYFIKSTCDSAYIWGTVAFAILASLSLILPFAKQFKISLGDLGLEFVLPDQQAASHSDIKRK